MTPSMSMFIPKIACPRGFHSVCVFLALYLVHEPIMCTPHLSGESFVLFITIPLPPPPLIRANLGKNMSILSNFIQPKNENAVSVQRFQPKFLVTCPASRPHSIIGRTSSTQRICFGRCMPSKQVPQSYSRWDT